LLVLVVLVFQLQMRLEMMAVILNLHQLSHLAGEAAVTGLVPLVVTVVLVVVAAKV
jgi:hypothetical protein